MRRLRLLRIAAPAIVVPSLLLCCVLGIEGNTVLWLGIAVGSIGVLSFALAAHVLLRRADD